MYACMHVCMYACMHVCMYACMHVCMYACMHVWVELVCFWSGTVCRHCSWVGQHAGQMNRGADHTVTLAACRPLGLVTQNARRSQRSQPHPLYTDQPNATGTASQALCHRHCASAPSLSSKPQFQAARCRAPAPWRPTAQSAGACTCPPAACCTRSMPAPGKCRTGRACPGSARCC